MVSNNQPNCRVTPGLRRQRTGRAGFTLIELLAVIVVILILTGLVIRVAGYVRYQVAVSTTKAQLATITAALEMYKADWGYYPKTNPIRLSFAGDQQGSNNFILYVSLAAVNSMGYSNVTGNPNPITYVSIIRTNRRAYMQFPAAQIRTNFATQYYDNSLNITNQQNTALPNIYDAFGQPILYYNSPQTPFSLTTTTMSGGQINPATYDLFSFGPDGDTYIGSPTQTGWTSLHWTNPASANDDIMGGSR